MAGGLTLLASTNAGIPTPGAGKVTIYFSTDINAPAYKDDTGVVHTLTGSTGPTGAGGPPGPAGFAEIPDEADIMLALPGPQGNPGPTGAAGPSGASGIIPEDPWLDDQILSNPAPPASGISTLVGAAIQVSRVALSEAQLEAFTGASANSVEVIPAQGSNKVIIPVFAAFEINLTAGGWGNNPSLTFRWSTDTTVIMSNLATPGFNATAPAIRLATTVCTALAALQYSTFDPRNKNVVVNLTAQLTNPGTSAGTGILVIAYYVCTVT